MEHFWSLRPQGLSRPFLYLATKIKGNKPGILGVEHSLQNVMSGWSKFKNPSTSILQMYVSALRKCILYNIICIYIPICGRLENKHTHNRNVGNHYCTWSSNSETHPVDCQWGPGGDRTQSPHLVMNVCMYLPMYLRMHCITLHYIILHYTTLQYSALHYITLRYITLHDITTKCIAIHIVVWAHTMRKLRPKF